MSEEINEVLENEEENNIIELTDENTGESVLFEHLDTIELNEKQYFVLTDYSENEEDEQSDVYIMTLVTNEDGSETLEIVEDKDEISTVYDIFKTNHEEDFDFLDE